MKAERLLKRARGSETSASETSDSDASSDEDEAVTPPHSVHGSDFDDRLQSGDKRTRQDSTFSHEDGTYIQRKKKKHKKKKSKNGKKRRAMWTEEEHRLFLQGYKSHPRNWNYLSQIVTSKTPTQIRTHAYSVFQRRRRVGTPLPSGFENMDHSWHRRSDEEGEDGEDGEESREYIDRRRRMDEVHVHHRQHQQMNPPPPPPHSRAPTMCNTPNTNTASPAKHAPQFQRNVDDPHEQLVMAALRERATKWTCATAMFPPQPPNASRGSGITLSNHFAVSIF